MDVGYIQSKQAYTPNQTIKVEFDYVAYNGTGDLGTNGGDGLSIYLFDAAAPNAGQGGYFYSALGYCRMQGAYVGIGLDEWGNFAANCERGAYDGVAAKDAVSVRRGWTTNYARLKTVQLPYSLDLHRPTQDYVTPAYAATKVRHVVATFTPKPANGGYTIDMTIDGAIVLQNVDYPYPAPTSVKLGIAASTGASTNNHEIRYLSVEATGGIACPDATNKACSVPSYITGIPPQPILNYPFLTDGNRVHAGWTGTGPWVGSVTLPAAYGIDFSGAPCRDIVGACTQPPGKGPVRVNTVVVWSRPNSGTTTEANDTTTFTQYGATRFSLQARLKGSQNWTTLSYVTSNDKVKRTVTFPTVEVSHLQVVVEAAAGNNVSPLVEIEAFER